MTPSHRPPSPVQIAALVAMASRRSDIHATTTCWRVRGWGRAVSVATVEGLVARGLLRWTTTTGRPVAATFTELGRELVDAQRRAA